MKHSSKLAILQTLDTLDQVQMENVLEYIKGILQKSVRVVDKDFKREAMREIRAALKQNKRSGEVQFA